MSLPASGIRMSEAKVAVWSAFSVSAVVAVPPLVVVWSASVRLLPVPAVMVMFPAPPVSVQAAPPERVAESAFAVVKVIVPEVGEMNCMIPAVVSAETPIVAAEVAPNRSVFVVPMVCCAVKVCATASPASVVLEAGIVAVVVPDGDAATS